MPNGAITTNPVYKILMILGDDKKWYYLPEKSTFQVGAKVTFTEWVRPDPPPGLFWAKDVSPATGAALWSTLKFSASSTPKVPAPVHLIPDTAPPVKPTSTASAPKQRILTDKTTQNDHLAIMKAVDNMNWSGKFGPSVDVETKLKWENAMCRELYLKVKEELHDQPIPGTKLFYYVGAIGNWGKGGFRISGHTKKASNVDNSDTNGVLHVENR